MKHVQARGARIPVLGLGTWMMEGRACRDAVADALAAGYRHVDTAAGYDNEEQVGLGLRDAAVPRDELFVTTKVAGDLSRAGVRRSAEASLRRLGLDHVDLFLVHWPSREHPLAETLDEMVHLVDDGRVRHLGVSNFPSALLERALRLAPIVANQVEYHPFLAQTAILGHARRAGIAVEAYSPLARGAVLSDPTLKTIAAAHDRTPAQVTLRWLVQQDGVVALPKAASGAHRRANLAIFDFELTEEEMARIHALDRGERLIDPSWAPDWDASSG